MKAKVLLYFITQLAVLSGYTVGAPSMWRGRRRLGLEGWWTGTHGKNWWETNTKTWCFPSFFKVVEAMEIMLIAVVSPVIRCEWQLENWQVALVTTVSACFRCFEWTNWEPGLLLPFLHPTRLRAKGYLTAWCVGFQSSWVYGPKLPFGVFLFFFSFPVRSTTLNCFFSSP